MPYLIKSPYENELDVSQEFIHSDNQQNFLKNCKKFGNQWIWSKRKITYKFNSYGYRMDKELDEVNLDNYIAFFGCSFTTGVGLPLEETYSYTISKNIGSDYINGAIGGSSTDFAFHNIVKLISTVPKKPKAIIVNWPELTRTFYWINDKMEFYLANHSPTNAFWNAAYQTFLIEESHINNRFKFYRETLSVLCKLANIKYYEFTTFQADPNFFKTHPNLDNLTLPVISDKFSQEIDYFNLYAARDINRQHDLYNHGAHPGLFFQRQVQRQVVNWITNA